MAFGLGKHTGIDSDRIWDRAGLYPQNGSAQYAILRVLYTDVCLPCMFAKTNKTFYSIDCPMIQQPS